MSSNETVVAGLRNLADAIESGKYMWWDVTMAMERPERELDPMKGECGFDAIRHYTGGDHITVTLNLLRGTKKENQAAARKD